MNIKECSTCDSIFLDFLKKKGNKNFYKCLNCGNEDFFYEIKPKEPPFEEQLEKSNLEWELDSKSLKEAKEELNSHIEDYANSFDDDGNYIDDIDEYNRLGDQYEY